MCGSKDLKPPHCIDSQIAYHQGDDTHGREGEGEGEILVANRTEYRGGKIKKKEVEGFYFM